MEADKKQIGTEEVTTDVTEKERTKMAVVIGCHSLNVRQEPKADADVVQILKAGVTVEVDFTESTIDFYKVHTESGAAGYCMKKFIKIQ